MIFYVKMKTNMHTLCAPLAVEFSDHLTFERFNFKWITFLLTMFSNHEKSSLCCRGLHQCWVFSGRLLKPLHTWPNNLPMRVRVRASLSKCPVGFQSELWLGHTVTATAGRWNVAQAMAKVKQLFFREYRHLYLACHKLSQRLGDTQVWRARN